MLKSTIILQAMTMPKNLKEGTEDRVRDILAFRTYSIEKERILSRQLNGKKVADLISESEKMFTGKDWTEFSDSEMRTAFAGSSDKMMELRDDFKECEAHLASCKCDTGLRVKTVHRFPISLLELKQYGRREVKDAEKL